MMNRNQLREYNKISFSDPHGIITLRRIAEDLAKELCASNIPHCFWYEQIAPGYGYPQTEGLLLYHPQHFHDYEWYMFTISRYGSHTFCYLYYGGLSQQGAALAWQEKLHSGSEGIVGDFCNHMIAKSYGPYTPRLHEDEKMWHYIIQEAINKILIDE